MLSAEIDFDLYQGGDFSFIIVAEDEDGKAIDLRGFSAVMQVRRQRDPKARLILNISEETGTLFINSPEQGEIRIGIGGQFTQNLPIGDFYYDLVLNCKGTEHNPDKDQPLTIFQRSYPLLTGRFRIHGLTVRNEGFS